MKVAVALSGGMDSLAALLYLKAEGHDVMGIHARFITPPSFASSTSPTSSTSLPSFIVDPAPKLAQICKDENIIFHVVDLREDFQRKVVQPFIQTYAEGKTPNPCAICNRDIKFGRLLDLVHNYGMQFMATGHYVNFADHPVYGQCLQRADDITKDQSYFLSLTPLDRLKDCVFPLAHLHKEDLRKELVARGLDVPLPKESQEICFIPNDDYRTFLEDKAHFRTLKDRESSAGIKQPKSSILLNVDGEFKKMGEHGGLWRYTEGQRKGLNISWKEPLYVISKDIEKNTLYVGTRSELDVYTASAKHINFLVPVEKWPEKLFVRIRYRQEPTKANVTVHQDVDSLVSTLSGTSSDISFNMSPDTLSDMSLIASPDISIDVVFDTPQSPYAAGQILAVYDADHVLLAGGILQ